MYWGISQVLAERWAMGARYGQSRASGGTCEVLEQRQLLAGSVTASVVDGDLVIVGDASSNRITIDQYGLAPDSVRVTPYHTLLDGNFFPIVFTGITGGIRAELFDGDDRLNLQDLSLPGGLQVQGGGGNDSVLLINAHLAGGLNTAMAAGADTVHRIFRRGLEAVATAARRVDEPLVRARDVETVEIADG